MRLPDGRPDHIEDYLITVRTGQWFGCSDSSNKIYANLIVHDGGSKPSESDCTTGLAALQSAWDEKNKEYIFYICNCCGVHVFIFIYVGTSLRYLL